MATIKFTTNLPLSSDPTCPKPWQFDPKYFDSIPDKPGVYIVGVKIPVSDPKQFDENGKPIDKAVEKFCPLIVGEASKLKHRIKQHWTGTGGSSLIAGKELFDLDIKGNTNLLYDSIAKLNDFRSLITSGHKGGNNNTLLNFPSDCKKCEAEKKMFKELIKDKNSLIWFPNPMFFNELLDDKCWQSSLYYHDADFYSHTTSLYYDLPKSSKSRPLIEKIVETKKIISSRFWFAYASKENNPSIEFNNKKIRETIEDNAKYALINIGINTYAKDKGDKNTHCIALTDIKDDLVNMTGNPFNITTNNQNEQVFII